MKQQLDTEHLNAWRLFITTHARLIETIDNELIAAGCISLAWYDVLVELIEVPEHRLRMHELAERVVLSRSTLTRLVDRLETAGLLQRQRSTSDRRGAYAVLTEAGMEAMRAAWPIYSRGIATHFARHLSSTEAEVLSEQMMRVLDALQ